VKERTGDLEVLKSRMQQILNTTPAIILTAAVTPPYNLRFVSDYARQLGFDAKDFLDTPLLDLKRVHPDDHGQVCRARLQVTLALESVDQDHPITVQCRVARPDGTYCWIQAIIRIERNADGVPLEIVACWMDLSHQKALEQKLEILSGPSVKLKVWQNSSKTLQALNPILLSQSWPLLQECLQAALAGETITGVVLQLRGKNGESLQGLLTTGPVKDCEGAFRETIGLVLELRPTKVSLH
jgi:hypothetical protein